LKPLVAFAAEGGAVDACFELQLGGAADLRTRELEDEIKFTANGAELLCGCVKTIVTSFSTMPELGPIRVRLGPEAAEAAL
jgi:hypothetical protein